MSYTEMCGRGYLATASVSLRSCQITGVHGRSVSSLTSSSVLCSVMD